MTQTSPPTAVLVSFGAPEELAELNGSWNRAPPVNNKPHYVKDGASSAVKIHVLHNGDSWRIMRSLDNTEQLLAEANGDAEHPNTVMPRDKWSLIVDGSHQKLEPSAEFQFACKSLGPNGISTEDCPFSMDDLGIDFFIRTHLTERAIFWYRSPKTGQVNSPSAAFSLPGTHPLPAASSVSPLLCSLLFDCSAYRAQSPSMPACAAMPRQHMRTCESCSAAVA